MSDTIQAVDYHELVRVGEPCVGPRGDRVAFVQKTPHGDDGYRATVWIVDVADGTERQFTVSEGVDSEPRFSPSGDRLAFVSTRGAEDDRPQLWVMPTTGGEARRVTDVVGGVSNITWSPDGTRLAFTQSVTRADREAGWDLYVAEADERDDPDPRVIDRTTYRTIAGYRDGAASHAYVVDVADSSEVLEHVTNSPETGAQGGTTTGTVHRVTDWNGIREVGGLDWGDDATLYYTRTPDDVPDPDDTIAFEVCAHDLETDTVESLTRSAAFTRQVAATEDGRVAYAARPEARATLRQTDLSVYDRRDDTTRVPTEPLDRTVGGFVMPGAEWGPDGEYLYFLTPDEGSMVVRRARWDASEPPERVTGDGKHVTDLSVGDGVLAYVAGEPDHPGDVFVTGLPDVDPADGEGAGSDEGPDTDSNRRLTTVNADYLADRAVAEPEEVWFEGPDGGERQGWLLLPPREDREDGREQFPLVVEIHGGPHLTWTSSASRFWWHEFQVLAARGYAVFFANPRGSTGYGEKFMAAIEGDWGGTTLADLEAGVDNVLEREEIDPDQQFVTGFSFGGYMTGWSVGHTDRFGAAVADTGIYDLASYYGSTDAYSTVEWEFGATPWEGADRLHEQSPVAYADHVETPVLLLHSERDFRTPINTTELFYRALRKNGVATRLVRYPREGHLLPLNGEPAHVVDRLERIVRWFDGYCDSVDAPPALDRGQDGGLSAGKHDDAGDDSETTGEDR